MAQTLRRSDPAARPIETRQGGQLRREQARRQPSLSTPTDFWSSVSPSASDCPAPYKSLAEPVCCPAWVVTRTEVASASAYANEATRPGLPEFPMTRTLWLLLTRPRLRVSAGPDNTGRHDLTGQHPDLLVNGLRLRIMQTLPAIALPYLSSSAASPSSARRKLSSARSDRSSSARGFSKKRRARASAIAWRHLGMPVHLSASDKHRALRCGSGVV